MITDGAVAIVGFSNGYACETHAGPLQYYGGVERLSNDELKSGVLNATMDRIMTQAAAMEVDGGVHADAPIEIVMTWDRDADGGLILWRVAFQGLAGEPA